MAKSLRSKIKRKYRTLKREKYHSRVIDALKNNGTENDPAFKKSYAKGFLERKGCDSSGYGDLAVEMEGTAEDVAEEAPADVDPDAEDLNAYAERILNKKRKIKLHKRKTAQVRRKKQRTAGL